MSEFMIAFQNANVNPDSVANFYMLKFGFGYGIWVRGLGTKFPRSAKILVNFAKNAKRNPPIFGEFSLKIDGFRAWWRQREIPPYYI